MPIESALADAQRLAAEGALAAALDRLAETSLPLDRAETLLRLELLAAQPRRTELERVCDDALASSGGDTRTIVAACRALVARADLEPMDAPPSADGPAARAFAALRTVAVKLDDAAAWSLLGSALRLCGPARDDEARAAFEHALGRDPRRGAAWADLAVLHKQRGRFDEGLRCAEKARALLGDQRGVLFNLALCATATGRGALAIECFRALGIDATAAAGGMPFVAGLPPALLRLVARGPGFEPGAVQVPDRAHGYELVSVQPLSPCHGVITTPTFRESYVDCGDVVAWDPAPVAVQRRDDGAVPVFALLARLHEGDERRLRFAALQQHAGGVEAVGAELPEGCVVFAQREHVEWVCPRCAAGDLLRKHEHEPAQEHRLVYGKLVVEARVELAALRAALERALAKHPDVYLAVPELYEALGDTAAAGKAHTAWRGLERTVLKTR